MTDRYTRKDAEGAFSRLAAALGKPTGHYRRLRDDEPDTDLGDGRIATIPGGWALDYNGVNGGFVVEQLADVGMGIFHPFGHERRSAREFCATVWFALAALKMGEQS